MNGCGGENTSSGGYCGGCPSDSIAPIGSTMLIVNGLKDVAINIPVTSTTGASGCWSDIGFEIIDDLDNPMNDICVELSTNGFIKPSKTAGDCTAATGEYVDYIRTRTDAGGMAVVDFATTPVTCADLGLDTTDKTNTTVTVFVQATSCRQSQVTTATITYTCIP
jgi:hypothetical protein